MNPRQRSVVTIVIVALVIAAVGVWFGVRKISERNAAAIQEQIEAERARQLRASIENLATRHDAVTSWARSLDQKLFSGTFTIEVEEALKPTNGQPVLVVGYLKDLAKRNGKYLVYIERAYRPRIYFILQCDQGRANSIKEQGRRRSKVAAIASIDTVKKPVLEARARALTGEEAEGEDAEIDIEPADSPFVASGRCLDLLFISTGFSE